MPALSMFSKRFSKFQRTKEMCRTHKAKLLQTRRMRISAIINPCRTDFKHILSNHERPLVVAESAENAHTTSKNTNILRKVTKSFNKELFLFCQIDLKNESSFNFCHNSRDVALKEALKECPNSPSRNLRLIRR